MNAIYKVIFNRATGQPVVVSEFGKGRQKSSTCKSIHNVIVFLLALNVMPSFSATCDIATYICNLDTTWTVAGNNNNYGATTISDGKTWLVNGVQSWEYSGLSYKNYTNLKNVVKDGYDVKTGGNIVTSLPSNSLSLKFSGLDKSIVVLDSITQSPKTIKVYSSTALTEVDPYTFSVSVNFLKQNASYYNNTQLIKVNNGVANVALSKGAVYSIGEIRNSYLAEVDGVSNNAGLNWISEQTFIASSIDWSNTSPTGNFTSNVSTYNGKFETFDGSYKNVNSLQEFKDYNDWLVSSIENGLLDPGRYIYWLEQAYDTTTTKYEYSPFPANADASNIPNAEGAIIYAHGSGALATISQLGKIEVHNGATNTFKVIVGEDGSTIINDGKIIATGRILDLTSGATFINNKLLSLGGGNTSVYSNGQYSKTPIMLMNKGTLFHNAGVYNINARHVFNGGNGIVYGITLKDNATATNDGLINSGYWYGDTGLTDSLSGSVRSVVVSDGASFTNQNGIIQLGIGEDGVSSDYLGNESAAIEIINNGTALNAGNIVLGSNADGVFGFLANGNNIQLLNVGTIDVNSDGNGGQFTPAQSTGIYSQNGASGNIDNAGIINLNGSNNVGVKAVSGGGASSSGVINVNRAYGQSALPNYGVWVEDAGSQVNVAGKVNLNGDGAIGVHARNAGTISLTDNASVNFSSGKNQIGYFVYGAGSQIINNSSSMQDVTSDNSALMRLDGGATFTGSATQGSRMVASGQYSVILTATGKSTSVSTGTLALDIAGRGATGVLVEGGATGVIDASTNLLLNNASAIAAIADGDGHDISGKFTSNESSTKLDSSANLSSAEDQVTGYIARNGATLENSGNIHFSGKNTTGLKVLDGSTGTNSGSITVQDGGKGLVASSTNQSTTINNTGNLTCGNQNTSAL